MINVVANNYRITYTDNNDLFTEYFKLNTALLCCICQVQLGLLIYTYFVYVNSQLLYAIIHPNKTHN